jgi:hypothetical protein
VKPEWPFRESREIAPREGRTSVLYRPFKVTCKHPVTAFYVITVSESLCYKGALSLACYVSCKLTFVFLASECSLACVCVM